MDNWYSIKEYLVKKGVKIYVLFTDTDSVEFSVYAPNEAVGRYFQVYSSRPRLRISVWFIRYENNPDGTRIPLGTKEDPAPPDNPYFCQKINKKVFGKFKFAEKNLLNGLE